MQVLSLLAPIRVGHNECSRNTLHTKGLVVKVCTQFQKLLSTSNTVNYRTLVYVEKTIHLGTKQKNYFISDNVFICLNSNIVWGNHK